MPPLPEFEKVSVISDLHMGGQQGFQIFTSGKLLAAFIDQLTSGPPGPSALVLNGDTVDFLAARNPKYFDPEGAVEKLKAIMTDAAFKPVWDSLRLYLANPQRTLILTLGNHDIELAVPWVREHLIAELTKGNDAARARVITSFDGAGFACTVGGAGVLCIHGNEVDDWNVTDYEALRRNICDEVQGRPSLVEWIPNAGTKLVIDVMNRIKARYAFIDLLKPENQAAVRVLVALNPDLRPVLTEIAGVARKRIWDSARRAIGLLGAGESEGPTLTVPSARKPMPRDVAGLLERTEQRFTDGVDPVDIVNFSQSQMLGVWDALASGLMLDPPYKIAFEAIKEVAHDDTFNTNCADAAFEAIDALAGSGFTFVIAGHTHLARDLGRRKRSGIYYNSGTWADLIRLTPDQLASADAFQPVFEKLKSAKTVTDLGDLSNARPTVVTISKEQLETKAALQQVYWTASGGVELGEVDGKDTHANNPA